MIWVLISIVGLVLETMLIVFLGRRVTGDYDEAPALVVETGRLADDP